jgi:hypothetical protein
MADTTLDQLNNPYQEELVGLNRQRALANMLLQQNLQAPQGQMVSGRYVAPNPLQYLGNMAQIVSANQMSSSADKEQTALAAQLRGKQQEVMQAWSEAKTPQEKFAIGTSQYAPKALQSATYEMLKPQKLGEGETISQMNFGTGAYEPMAQGGQKVAPEVRQAMQFLGINKPLEQLSPQELNAIENKAIQFKRAGATSVSVNTGQHGFDNALKLRSDFRAEPIYKGFEETKAAKLQIDQAAKMASPAGDLAAATKIMKILDPGSVVRESELGMAMAATGVEDRVRNYANMVITGQKLTPGQRKDFVDLSDKLYNAAAGQFNQKRGEYAGIAERNKLDVEAAVGAPADVKKSKLRWNPQTGTFE